MLARMVGHFFPRPNGRFLILGLIKLFGRCPYGNNTFQKEFPLKSNKSKHYKNTYWQNKKTSRSGLKYVVGNGAISLQDFQKCKFQHFSFQSHTEDGTYLTNFVRDKTNKKQNKIKIWSDISAMWPHQLCWPCLIWCRVSPCPCPHINNKSGASCYYQIHNTKKIELVVSNMS